MYIKKSKGLYWLKLIDIANKKNRNTYWKIKKQNKDSNSASICENCAGNILSK